MDALFALVERARNAAQTVAEVVKRIEEHIDETVGNTAWVAELGGTNKSECGRPLGSVPVAVVHESPYNSLSGG